MYDRDDENEGQEATGGEPGDPVDPEPESEAAPEGAESVGGHEAKPDEAGASTDPEAPADEPEIVEPEPVPEPTEEELLRAQLEQSSARLRAVSKAYTDLQAEMHAFRERMENQARFKAERQAFDQARAFFDPVQNLKRSLATAPEDSALKQGVDMVLHQFEEALKKLGMEEVPGVGSDFNPAYHEALALTPVPDAAQDGKVLLVYADGYAVKGKVLQAAQVVVGKYQEPAGEA